LKVLGEHDPEVSTEILDAQIPAATAEEERAADALCVRCNRGPVQEIEIPEMTIVFKRCWNCNAVWSNQYDPVSYAVLQYEVVLDFLELSVGQVKYSVKPPEMSRGLGA
jgi:NMD protein affecting ribosome stability and mRNA decay